MATTAPKATHTEWAVKEWAAVIEALRQGLQVVLCRKQPLKVPQFLLYPTFSYYKYDKWEPAIQPENHDLVKKVSAKAVDDYVNNQIALRYFAETTDTIKVSTSKLASLTDEYIWTFDHIKNYSPTAVHIMIVRAYELPKSIPVGQSAPGWGDLTYYRHFEKIDISHGTPALSDDAFTKRRKMILAALS